VYIKKVLIHTHIPNVIIITDILPFLGPQRGSVVAPRPPSPPWAAVNSGSWSQPLAGDGGEAVTGSFLGHFMGKSWEHHGKIIGISMGRSLEVVFFDGISCIFFGTSLELFDGNSWGLQGEISW